MNTFPKTCLGAITLLLIIFGCSPEENQKATITIKSTTQQNSTVKLSVLKDLDKVTLLEAAVDSAGNCSFELELSQPTTALIQIGKKYGEVYLAPGYSLVIKENGQDYKIPLTFSGKGADVNNYISWVNSNIESVKWAYGKGLYGLDITGFRNRFDSLKTIVANFHEEYMDSVALPAAMVAMLVYKKKVKFSVVQQEFKFYKLNDLNNKRWEAHRKGEEFMFDHVAVEIANLSDEMPFDSVLMRGSYADYEGLLKFYWRNNVYLPTAAELIGTDSLEAKIPLLCAARIKKADCVEAVRERLLAFNINYWLGAHGITPATDSIFNEFKGEYAQSETLRALNKTYNGFVALAPGNPAPEFEGLTRDGKNISTKDLRGKIVYIDVWATWCGPCIAEIPSSVKLQQRLAKEDGVQFLNVSVDTKKPDWENFLEENSNWPGIHINIEPGKIDSFYRAYKLSGIPAYLLLDQAGNIIDLKAPRPTDETLETRIRQALAELNQESLPSYDN